MQILSWDEVGLPVVHLLSTETLTLATMNDS